MIMLSNSAAVRTTSRKYGLPAVSPKPRMVAACKAICSQGLRQERGIRMRLQEEFLFVDACVAVNASRFARAMRECTPATHATGYASTLDQMMARLMGTESALATMRLLSGTHAISVGIRACLRPGDLLLSVCGAPYDTLEEVIGTRGPADQGSLAEFGIRFHCLPFPLNSSGNLDEVSIARELHRVRPRVCHIQRSCGYSLRPTLRIEDLRAIIKVVRRVDPEIIVAVDNCYGEFTETLEPGHAGADVVMGSFIKNPGGTIATGGGYVAGRSDIINAIRGQCGFHAQPAREAHALLHGLWLAPGRVGEALKGGRLMADFARQSGFKVPQDEPVHKRPSYITAIQLECPERMVKFCEIVQQNSPVGSYVKPVAGTTPGYESKVIFADGTFVDGCTSELSADGPIRPPYVVYCQGGTHWVHWRNVILALSRENL